MVTHGARGVERPTAYLTQLAGPEPKGTLATARVSGTCYRNFEIRWRPVLPRLGFGGLKVP